MAPRAIAGSADETVGNPGYSSLWSSVFWCPLSVSEVSLRRVVR